ncbi:hypothetical protein CWB99_13475 [Pseudoalteromonas rubra]|uniref:Uncharacterized protein n=1 Tax=Pseudoalteromonas rubra TaxID=43658 RepID=A0A5S3WM92_9GAMM|nr:hypothetical protein [Pseudoalteromonas rubra]TMP27938.1 hypothetical protein CWB99_13475 [Pseudoalteromonas rubra]TMP31190.1 hypothetical protein CWC00_14815 [Pseudoalteromonas rubra]
MKLNLNKKNIKTLSADKATLALQATPQVAGGAPKSYFNNCAPTENRECWEDSIGNCPYTMAFGC